MVFVLVILSVLTLVTIDILIFSKNRKKSAPVTSGMQVFNLKDTVLPEDYMYSKSHTWIKKSDNNLLHMGLDGFLFNALGNIKIKSSCEIGRKIEKGDVLCQTSVNGVDLKVKSPVSGIITNINENYSNSIANEPSEWFIQIKPNNFKEDSKSLIPAKESHKWIKNEFKRLKDLLYNSIQMNQLAGVTMYDGGNIAEGAVSFLEADSIRDFEELFMRV